ncbi:hypothetical protein Tco_1539537 [Tanacetum coccineum]
MNNLETLLNAETLHEMDSKSALSVIKVQFERFINSDLLKPLDIYSRSFSSDREVIENFRDYTKMTAQTFKETIIQNMNSIEQCIIERASHEQELKMTLKKLSERQLQIQQCKVQEVQSSVTSSGDETSSGMIDEEIDIKQKLEATITLHGNVQEGIVVSCTSEQTDEFKKYKAFNDRTIDYEILQTKLNETLGLLALKDIEIKEGLKTKAYEISALNQKHDELVKKSLLTKSQLEGYLKEKSKVISDLKVKEEKDIDKMIEMDKQLMFLNEIVYTRNQSIQTIHMLAPKCSTYNGRSNLANPSARMVSQKMSYIKWCLLKITLQAPFLNVQMTFEHSSSSLGRQCQMMSDHNSSDLAPQRQEMSVENVSSGLVPQEILQSLTVLLRKTTSCKHRMHHLQEAEFINPFCTRVQRKIGESSSRNMIIRCDSFQPSKSAVTDWTKRSSIRQFMEIQPCQFKQDDSLPLQILKDELHQFDKTKSPGNSVETNHVGKMVIKLNGYGRQKRMKIRLNSQKSSIVSNGLFHISQMDVNNGFLMVHEGRGLQMPPVPKRVFLSIWPVRFRKSKKINNMDNCHSIGTPLATKPKLDVDLSGEPVDQSDYHSKIGSLMYLTSSRPDLVQADSGFELTAFSDADHARCLDTRKSTSEGYISVVTNFNVDEDTASKIMASIQQNNVVL